MRKPVIKITYWLLLPVLFACLIACGNDDDTTVEAVPPNTANISFTSPTADSLYAGNGNIVFSGAINSTYPIQGYKMVLRNKADNSVILSKDFQDKDTLVAFNEVWKSNVSNSTNLELEIRANLDVSSNTFSELRTFQAAP